MVKIHELQEFFENNPRIKDVYFTKGDYFVKLKEVPLNEENGYYFAIRRTDNEIINSKYFVKMYSYNNYGITDSTYILDYNFEINLNELPENCEEVFNYLDEKKEKLAQNKFNRNNNFKYIINRLLSDKKLYICENKFLVDELYITHQPKKIPFDTLIVSNKDHNKLLKLHEINIENIDELWVTIIKQNCNLDSSYFEDYIELEIKIKFNQWFALIGKHLYNEESFLRHDIKFGDTNSPHIFTEINKDKLSETMSKQFPK